MFKQISVSTYKDGQVFAAVDGVGQAWYCVDNDVRPDNEPLQWVKLPPHPGTEEGESAFKLEDK